MTDCDLLVAIGSAIAIYFFVLGGLLYLAAIFQNPWLVYLWLVLGAIVLIGAIALWILLYALEV